MNDLHQKRRQQQQQQQQEQQSAAESNGEKRTYTFVVVPKGSCTNTGPFFQDIFEGCQDRAEELGNVQYECFGNDRFPSEPRKKQAEIITNITLSGNADGIAIAVVRNESLVLGPIAQAVDAGIPVVTFDSDAPNSKRLAYIGTDNVAMGRELGKVLQQLRPEGGKYAIVSGTGPNLLDRQKGVHEELEDTEWTEIGGGVSPLVPEGNDADLMLDQMWEMAEANPDLKAIMPVFGTPMRATLWKEFAKQFRDRITLVNTDMSAEQIDLLSKGYVDGLVGQQPYEMGRQTMSVLLELQSGTATNQTEIYGTNFIEILRVPYVLPPVDYDYNYLGSLTILGYTLYAIVAVISIGFSAWTVANRKKRVVRASQPVFLYLICAGVLIFASTIISFGIDDENHSQRGCDMACMSIPWMASAGFSLVFSALFSKIWRVNKLFHNPNRFQRMKVTVKDVILPLVLLMAANVIVLACWTALNPLQFVRVENSGTDLWNRPTSSHGMCRVTGSVIPYLVPIGVINLGALVFAIVQAYKARDIRTEFSESKYVMMVFASILQAAVIGIPIIVLSRNDPAVTYVVQTVIVFILGTVILLLIFVPKYLCHKEWKAKHAKKNQRRATTMSTCTMSGGSDGLKVMVAVTALEKLGADKKERTDLQYSDSEMAPAPFSDNRGRFDEEEVGDVEPDPEDSRAPLSNNLERSDEQEGGGLLESDPVDAGAPLSNILQMSGEHEGGVMMTDRSTV